MADAPKAFAIFCEEVRQEPGGKHTILGAFAGDLLVSTFPAVLRMAVYGVLFFEHDGHHKFEWRMTLAGETVATANAETDVKGRNATIMIAPMGMLQVQEPCELRFDLSLDGGDFANLAKTKLMLPEASTSSTAPAPPSAQSKPARKRTRRRL